MKETLFFNDNNGASFSGENHRFALWRIWDNDLSKVMFIGLNPSIADAIKDDPTIRRIKGFVKSWGYGGFYMLNLFTVISTNPNDLIKCECPDFRSDEFLLEFSKDIDKIIFAWGNHKTALNRAKKVIQMFPDAYCLGKNKDGSPKHPLYLSSKTELIKFNPL